MPTDVSVDVREMWNPFYLFMLCETSNLCSAGPCHHDLTVLNHTRTFLHRLYIALRLFPRNLSQQMYTIAISLATTLQHLEIDSLQLLLLATNRI